MTKLLFFILSWLCGMFLLLVAAFLLYDQFSIIDITSFAVFTFASSLIITFILYTPFIWFFNKKVNVRNQFAAVPLVLITLANLPVYFFIWLKTGDLYGRSEAFLFMLFFMTAAFVFGLCTAWKNTRLGRQS